MTEPFDPRRDTQSLANLLLGVAVAFVAATALVFFAWLVPKAFEKAPDCIAPPSEGK